LKNSIDSRRARRSRKSEQMETADGTERKQRKEQSGQIGASRYGVSQRFTAGATGRNRTEQNTERTSSSDGYGRQQKEQNEHRTGRRTYIVMTWCRQTGTKHSARQTRYGNHSHKTRHHSERFADQQRGRGRGGRTFLSRTAERHRVSGRRHSRVKKTERHED